MRMKTVNLETARQIAHLHVIAAVARAILLDSTPHRLRVPTYAPAGLGTTVRARHNAPGEAALAAMVLRHELTQTDSPAATRARQDLRIRGESRPVTKREEEENRSWLQRNRRADRDPGEHTYLVRIPALTVETRDGHVLTVQGQQLTLAASGGAYAAIRGQGRMPVKEREGRWFWDNDVKESVRNAWSELAGRLHVTFQESRKEDSAGVKVA